MQNLLFATKPANLDTLRLTLRPDTQPGAASMKVLEELAAYHFESGACDYTVWAERMIAELGDSVTPRLRKLWISIPKRVSSRADGITSNPLTTQAERVAAGLRCKDLIAIWQDSWRNKILAEEMDVSPHSHFCPVCVHEWTCSGPECVSPEEYWCEAHAGSQPLLHRLKSDMHDHYCSHCGDYWGHRYRECLLPMAYQCEGHGGLVDEESLRESARRSRGWINSTNVAMLRKYVPVFGCILVLLLAAFSEWPYGFYVLLRLVVCTVSVYWAVEMFKQRRVAWTWAFGANAVLFNPVFPIHMARSDWEVINLLDAVFLAAWAILSLYRERRKQKMNWDPPTSNPNDAGFQM